MFWDNLERLCFEHKTAATTVVRNLGMSASVVTGWSRGSVPRKSTVKKIADYFGVTVDELLTGKSAEEQKKNSPETVSGIETAQMLELIQLFDAASPEIRQAALAVLRSAEAQK